jgi:hypothetical protein
MPDLQAVRSWSCSATRYTGQEGSSNSISNSAMILQATYFNSPDGRYGLCPNE